MEISRNFVTQSREFSCFRQSVKRQLKRSSYQTISLHALPRRLYHHRDIDKSDPDDWWGASIGIASSRTTTRSHGQSSTRDRTSHRRTDDVAHDESDFWYFESSHGNEPKTYYYHEYHYMHYYHTQSQQNWKKSGAQMDVSSPDHALEMASRSFAIALETAAIEIQNNTCTDASTDELENTIIQEIRNVAEYCGSDIVSFARVIGVLDVESMPDSTSREILLRKARKSIVFRFHPDRVNHLKNSGKRLSYLLGHSILQALSTMQTR